MVKPRSSNTWSMDSNAMLPCREARETRSHMNSPSFTSPDSNALKEAPELTGLHMSAGEGRKARVFQPLDGGVVSEVPALQMLVCGKALALERMAVGLPITGKAQVHDNG